MIHCHEISIADTASGAGSAQSAKQIVGVLVAVQYVPSATPFLTGADLRIYGARYGGDLLTCDDLGTAQRWWYPGRVPHDSVGGAQLESQTGEPSVLPVRVLDEYVAIAVDDAGDDKAGTFRLFVDDGR